MKILKITLCFGLLYTVACSRKAENTTTVLIQLPSAEKVSSASQSILSDDNPDDDDLNWSSDIPDGLITDTTASKPINCYAVMVEGPEPLMRVNTCGRRNSTMRVIDTNLFNFRVGLWMGAIPGGSNSAPAAIPFEVPAGLARTFRLIGFHVQNPVDCVLLQGDPDLSKMSRPYVIAQSAPIDLVPGEKDVPLQMVFDSEKWFDDCDFGGPNNASPVIATKLQIRKESFPAFKFVQDSSNVRCQPLEIQLTDAVGRPAILPPGLNSITYKLVGTIGATPINPLLTFNSKGACISNSSATSTFDIFANNSQAVRRWVSVPPGGGSVNYALSVQETSRNPSTAAAAMASDSILLPTVNPNSNFMQLLAPPLALKGDDYEVELVQRKYDGDTFVIWTGAAFTMSNPSYFSFYNYDGNQCLSAALPPLTTTSSFTNSTGPDFLEKFCLSFTDIAEQYSSVNTSGPPSQMVASFGSRGGGQEAQRLRVVGSNQISRPAGATARCFGPFLLMLENEYGAVVKNKESSAIQVSYEYRTDTPVNDLTATVPIEFHTNVTVAGSSPNFVKNCSSTSWLTGITQSIGTSSYQLPFYVKVPQTADLGWRHIQFKASVNGRAIRGSFRFSIDESD